VRDARPAPELIQPKAGMALPCQHDDMQRRPSPAVWLALPIAPAALWLGEPDGLAGWGRVAAWAGALLMLWSLALVQREKAWMDRLGGLEAGLRWHHRWGLAGYALLGIHALLQYRPVHGLAMAVAQASLILLSLGLAAAYWRGLSWRPWLRWHGLLGLGLLGGWAHAASHQRLAGVGLLLAAGLLAWRVWAFDRGGRSLPYRVSAVQRPSSAVVELTLAPLGAALTVRPGQFVLLGFESSAGYKGCGEFHPFTVSGVDSQGVLRVDIKALGSCTTRLQQVQQGATARVQGPFGQELDNASGQPCLWLAGGMGITPFLAALRRGPLRQDTVLIHAHRPGDALFVEELRARADADPLLHWVEVDDERPNWSALLAAVPTLSVRRLRACGPPGMLSAVRQALERAGLSGDRLQVDHFDLRS
jgi:predicted ferric reductase